MRKPMANLDLAKNVFQTMVLGTVGGWLGSCLYLWWDYQADPGFYATQSAPWWVGLVVRTAAFGLLLAADFGLYWAVRRWLSRREKR